MKTLAALFILVLGQSAFVYSDSKGDLTLHSNEGQGTMVKNGPKYDLKLDLRGKVQIASRRQKFVLNADRVQAYAVPTKESKSPNEIRSATATGGVKFSQSADQRSSTIQCATAVYNANGDIAKLDARGSVRIQSFDAAKKQNLTAAGATGTATLDKNAKDGAGLREATLTTSVKVDIVDLSTKGGHAIFTGDRLTMTQKQIVLTGHVKAQGSVAERLGNIGGMQKLTVDLNDKKEMTGFSFSGGGK